MESHPSMELDDFTGTPITGNDVKLATMPGKWAAPPAPAIITLMPRARAFVAYSTIRRGVRCADTTVTSHAMFNSSNILAASCITTRSDWLPIMMPTSKFFML